MKKHLRLPSPFPWQKELLEDAHRFQCALIGRRGAKSATGVIKVLVEQNNKPGLYWWVGLSWKSASMRRAWRMFKRYTHKVATAIHETDKTIYLPNGTEIWMRTAEQPEGLAGEGVRGCVLDEFTLMSENVWTEYIRQTLVDFKGWALFLGVPKGPGWHAELFDRGKDGKDAKWRSWQLSTLEANPLLDPEEIEDMRRTLTDRMFRQEVMAEIISDGGNVLTTRTCVIPCHEVESGHWVSDEVDGPLPYHQYVISCDWARDVDYSWFTVWDATFRRMVEFIKISKVQYTVQIEKLKALNKKWKPYVVPSEETGNKYLHEALIRTDIPIQTFQTTHQSKNEAILGYAIALEREEIWLFNQTDIIKEHAGFVEKQLPGGGVKYEGGKGIHDDSVMSAVIGWNWLRLMPSEEQMTGKDRVALRMARHYSQPAVNILDGMSREFQEAEWKQAEKKNENLYYQNKKLHEFFGEDVRPVFQ